MLHYDLIIVGGGLVGASLAVALRQTGLRIALIDAKLTSSDDPRLFALNSSSCQFLENLKIWPSLAAHAAPIHQVHVSNHGHFGVVRLRREDVNLPALGHVVPACIIEAALNEELMALPNFTLYRPAKLKTLCQKNNNVQLIIATANGEKILQSPIVFGADGPDSTVREQLNIHTEIFDYEQSAIVVRTTLKRSHEHIAYERFNVDGAIAMLPLTGNECATIWTANTKAQSQLMELSDEIFLQKLQHEFGYRLGRLQLTSKRHIFPLRMVRAKKIVDQGVFLLGNSAHTLHPIAAQGFNLALYKVAMLAESMMEKISKNEVFTASHLQEISVQIQKQQATSIGISHRLSALFSSHSFLPSIALQLGMISLNVTTPIKKRFIERMLGKTGCVPRLLLSQMI